MKSALRNHFAGTIVEVIRGDEVSEVEIETDAGIITSVMANRVLDALALGVGDPVVAAIRPTDIFVEKLEQAA
jgi:molybdopterin-binding protein